MLTKLNRTSRRRFLQLAATGAAAGALGFAGHAQEARPTAGTETGAEFITPETQAAIDRGLAFLARFQLESGAFIEQIGGGAVAITALAGLALMAGGNQPGHGRYGRAVSQALDFVLDKANGPTPGFLASADAQSPPGRMPGSQSAMYSHGFGCLFLSEVCGMVPEQAKQKKVRSVLEQAVAFTVAAKNKEGGWRYEPRPAFADISVTVAQMMALRAAKNAGIFVPKNVIDAGAAYIRECQMPDGGFSYFKGQEHSPSAFARSAAALVGLYSAGTYEGKEIDRGLRYVQQFMPGRQYSPRDVPPQHYYYGQYYAALAMWTAGGEYWSRWFPAIRDELLAKARVNSNTWSDMFHGPAYATAMSLIVLQLPNNYLPILQK